MDAALEAIAHDERIAFAQLLHEALEAREIVAVVGIAHDDVASARRGDSGCKRGTVAPLGHRHDARSRARRERRRAVVRAIVGHQHFPGDACALQESARLAYAASDGRRLVEARHEDRELRHPRRRVKKKGTPKGTF